MYLIFFKKFQLDGPKAGQIIRDDDDEPDFYKQAYGG